MAWLLAARVVCGAAVAGAQSIDGLPESRFVEQRETFTPPGLGPIELRLLIAREVSGQQMRVVQATRTSLTTMSGWFGALPAVAAGEGPPSLTVAGVPWRNGVGASDPGVAIAPLRWLVPGRDQSTERAVIAAIARQYWRKPSPADPLEESLIIYTATRAIHELLEGSNFETLRFFGGSVPFSLRSLLLSPPVGYPRPRVWGFAEVAAPPAAAVRRGVRALQTIERYVGWPTLLSALSRMRESGRHDAASLAAALSEIRGTDLRSLVGECLREGAVFDYSLDGLHSAPGTAGLIETTVTINRRGSGRFTNGDQAGDREAAMPLLVRFADGSQARDHFDGAAPSVTLVYSAKTAAIAATIDPDAMLILDDNRDNNAILHDAPTSPLGLRLALNWMTWLQNAMLSYAALV
jgi:hypothetical protein